jgi:hypothetical protein
VRGTVAKILSATFGLAALLIILEHAGGFSKVLDSSAGAYATGFAALTGHATPAASSGVKFRKA